MNKCILRCFYLLCLIIVQTTFSNVMPLKDSSETCLILSRATQKMTTRIGVRCWKLTKISMNSWVHRRCLFKDITFRYKVSKTWSRLRVRLRSIDMMRWSRKLKYYINTLKTLSLAICNLVSNSKTCMRSSIVSSIHWPKSKDHSRILPLYICQHLGTLDHQAIQKIITPANNSIQAQKPTRDCNNKTLSLLKPFNNWLHHMLMKNKTLCWILKRFTSLNIMP